MPAPNGWKTPPGSAVTIPLTVVLAADWNVAPPATVTLPVKFVSDGGANVVPAILALPNTDTVPVPAFSEPLTTAVPKLSIPIAPPPVSTPPPPIVSDPFDVESWTVPLAVVAATNVPAMTSLMSMSPEETVASPEVLATTFPARTLIGKNSGALTGPPTPMPPSS